jgi:2-polyprenyl-3-methyl-5-hydroxy-6-metoxy-1,4-benzoquinol methylase
MPYQSDPEGAEIQALLDFAGSLDGKRVLEIGAGAGRLTWRYAAQAAHVTAIDPNPARIKMALENLPAALRKRVTFQAIGIEDFGREGGLAGFDMAILSWSL